MLAKVLLLGVFVSSGFFTATAIAQSVSSSADMRPNQSSARACQLLTEKEVLDHIPTKKGVQIVDEKDEPSHSSCVWVRNDLNLSNTTEEPFQLTLSWQHNLTDDYLLERASRAGEPVQGIGDKAYWLTTAQPSLLVWFENDTISVQIMGGQASRSSAKLAAERALRRIKTGQVWR
ncbi:hypothetical protein [Idiomarina xiamenensis]|uniref:DUF3558 domain-containing protein n=1 Tax=Idiomarina xiamenensis 10-D-4 TaxID=740709 RepID=K2JZE7_9GAMM|nr:hypothetical protein [Idiomarina xiamenensis]EKE79962.1 hypothetical protein A10D4_12298 [Idiomarina xiamenensis 10-D-4]